LFNSAWAGHRWVPDYRKKRGSPFKGPQDFATIHFLGKTAQFHHGNIRCAGKVDSDRSMVPPGESGPALTRTGVWNKGKPGGRAGLFTITGGEGSGRVPALEAHAGAQGPARQVSGRGGPAQADGIYTDPCPAATWRSTVQPSFGIFRPTRRIFQGPFFSFVQRDRQTSGNGSRHRTRAGWCVGPGR